MNFRDFMPLAASLANGTTEAEWRSATSRAYYAAFHVACELLRTLGFVVPKADRAHAYAWRRLSYCGDTSIEEAARNLNDLRSRRNKADYDGGILIIEAHAERDVKLADVIIDAFDEGFQEPVRTQITEAMKIYERDILKEETWKS
jgi:uncharacterized protein (UPF0332 family)